MAIKGIIFDLDGVIVSTDQYHYKAWKQLADRLGIYFDRQINQRLRGVSRMESLNIILERYTGPAFSEEEKEKLAEEKNTIYRGLLNQMGPDDIEVSVRDTLKELKKKGYALAIGSSSKNARFILNKTQITDLFDAISDGTNIKKSKPNPEVFQKAAEYLKLPPECCAVVEDADAGIEAAKAGGMTAIALGSHISSELMDTRINNFYELMQIFH